MREGRPCHGEDRRARSSASRCRPRRRSASDTARCAPRRDGSPPPSRGTSSPASGPGAGRLVSHGLARIFCFWTATCEHAPQRSVVAMHRRRRDAGGDLVVEPVLDLVGRKLAESVRTEPRQHVPVEIASVGLLRRRRQSPAERQELLGPLGEWHLSVAWIDPRAAHSSASISRRKRSASALRVNVRDWTRPSGSR